MNVSKQVSKYVCIYVCIYVFISECGFPWLKGDPLGPAKL